MGKFNGLMTFKNRLNECIECIVGGVKRQFWISRSVAVVGLIIVDSKILMVKRGPGCPDEIGKWVLPCGYLDWDETLKEAMYRETFEETGINLIEMRDYAMNHNILMQRNDSFADDDGAPVYVRSNPGKDKKQNVSTYMMMEIVSGDVDKMPIPEWNPAVCDSQETADVAWFDINQLFTMNEAGEIGFSHFDMIHRFA